MQSVISRTKRLLCVLFLCIFTYISISANVAQAGDYSCNPNLGGKCGDNNDNRITITHNIYNYPNDDVGRAEAFAGGVIVGAIGGSAVTIATVSSAGSVAGLSAAGITSGLAAIGSMVGGGMAAGIVVSATAPVATAVAVGYTAYKTWDWLTNKKEDREHSL
ncbi:hypothetical protein [Planktothricoides raciborskii]|uniref:Uncharacterized protein n=1 Tax=Planktothricoides raciborskii GIHE-MW2 TaxID=2792601 RepID=A0AAU8JGQ1_9CYAN